MLQTNMPLMAIAGLIAATCVGVPAAGATVDALALNGTYRATSNGDWAQTNDVYRDEQTVRSVWTISSSCSGAFDCSGTVTSDQGWTAPIAKSSQTWTVEHQLETWQPCPDGTAAPARQLFRFYPVTKVGRVDIDNESTEYAGTDKTVGRSGNCGSSRELAINMPFRLEKIA